jgi:hypothetical protein
MFWLILKQIRWIVFALDLYQSVVVVAVGGFESIESFVHHEIHISTSQTVGMNCRCRLLITQSQSETQFRSTRTVRDCDFLRLFAWALLSVVIPFILFPSW